MTLDDIITQYNVSRLTALAKIANAKLVAYGGKYDTMAVERLFAPPQRAQTDRETTEELYDYLREIGW